MALHSYKCPKCGATNINQDKHDKIANFELDDSDLVCKTCGHVDSEIKFLYDGQENLIKHTCRELGLTYKQLGEAIGYSESAIKNAGSGEASEPMRKAIELYKETLNLKSKLEKSEAFKNNLKDFLAD
jgi:hypothetical protein